MEISDKNKQIKLTTFMNDILDKNKARAKAKADISIGIPTTEKAELSRKSKRRRLPVDRYTPETIRRTIKGHTSVKNKTGVSTNKSKTKITDTLFTKQIESKRKEVVKFNQIKFDELKELFLIKLSKTLSNKIFSTYSQNNQTTQHTKPYLINNQIDKLNKLDILMGRANDILLSSSIVIKSNSMFIINYPFGKQYNVVSYPVQQTIDYICSCPLKSGCEHILAITLIPLTSYLSKYIDTTNVANNTLIKDVKASDLTETISIDNFGTSKHDKNFSADFIIHQLQHLTI